MTPDAIGSILVGVLLAIVAVVLIDRNRRFLVGEDVSPEVRQKVLQQLLDRPDIDRITYLHLSLSVLIGCTWLPTSTWPVTMWSTTWPYGCGTSNESWRSMRPSRRPYSPSPRPMRHRWP